MIKRIAVLGSTGSIGRNTLDVITRFSGRFEVVALAAESNVALLAGQARRFRPKIVSVGDEALAVKMKKLLPSGAGTKVAFGLDGLKEIVRRSDVDLVVFAISGTACLIPLAEAIVQRKEIALANKEALVSAGEIIMKLAEKNNVHIIPVDSEHSAIFQCLEGRRQHLSKIYLTGSGGPLLNIPKSRFDKMTRSFILNHPKWKMGKKISVDSATMMNKGLEIIEAKHLFDIDESSVSVLIHPEAIIHSMVELVDGTVLAQLARPDMRLPIQYALTYPARAEGVFGRIDFSKIGKLSFRKPDAVKFPCLRLAREALRSGGTHPAALAAADEEAVGSFLAGRIRFSEIPKVIEKVLMRHRGSSGKPTLGGILEADARSREEARKICYR